METNEIINPHQIKLIEEDFEVEFDFEYIVDKKHKSISDIEIERGLSEVDRLLEINDNKINELNNEIERLTNHADRLDYTIAVSSGIIAGLIDSFWVGEFKFERGKAWSNETVNKFVIKVAQSQGYEGDRLNGAIKSLEDKFPIPSDNVWSGQDVGISAKSHHLDDMSHHPTPIGLFFSILTQFTHKGYFQNSEGTFFAFSISEKGELIGDSFPTKIFSGIVNWFFHLVSDMSGSNKTAGVGMGIPGPIVSLLKEFSLLPVINKTGLAKQMREIFVKEKFDLRSELAVTYELGRQAIPVIMNEVVVRGFYFIRRLFNELKLKKSIKDVDWKKTLPLKNRTIARMLTISTGTFTLIDLADATIRGAIKSGGNLALFAKEFILRVNFIGVGRFAIAVGVDISMGIQREKRRNERIVIMNQQLHLMNAKIFYLQGSMWKAAMSTAEAIEEVKVIMEKTAVYAIETWEENTKSMENVGKSIVGIKKHNPELINDITEILKWG